MKNHYLNQNSSLSAISSKLNSLKKSYEMKNKLLIDSDELNNPQSYIKISNQNIYTNNYISIDDRKGKIQGRLPRYLNFNRNSHKSNIGNIRLIAIALLLASTAVLLG